MRSGQAFSGFIAEGLTDEVKIKYDKAGMPLRRKAGEESKIGGRPNIPIQRCYPEDYLEYSVFDEYIGHSMIPLQMFSIRFRKDTDMLLFPHACMLFYFELDSDERVRVRFVGRLTKAMSTRQNKGTLYTMLRLPPNIIFESPRLKGLTNAEFYFGEDELASNEKMLSIIRIAEPGERLRALLGLIMNGGLGFTESVIIDEFMSGCIFGGENRSIEEIISGINYSPRYVRLIIKEYAGTSVKGLYDIIRLQNIIGAEIDGDVDPMSCVYDNGFYDQTHMNKSIKKLTGFSYTSFKSILKEKNKTD